MKLKVLCAFEFKSIEEYKDALKVAKHKFYEIEEDFNYCVNRERGKEVLTCRENNFPYVVFLTESQKIIDANVNIESLDSSTQIFYRKKTNQENNLFGLESFVSLETENKILHWYKYINKKEKYLKRNVYGIKHKDFNKELSKLDLPIFIKTVHKVNSLFDSFHHVIDDTNIHLFNNLTYSDNYLNYKNEESEVSFTFIPQKYFNPYFDEYEQPAPRTHSLMGDFIISDVMDIEKDGLSDNEKVEYRCFVINNSLSSISRYVDYKDIDIDVDSIDFVKCFINDHLDVFGNAYVLDIAKTKKGYQVVELNPIYNSGRYLNNDPYNLFQSLNKGDFEIVKPSIDIPNIEEKPKLDKTIFF